jgi:two-component system cell cycle response regulator CtrA
MRILFIEDDSITSKSIQKLLQNEGFICDISDTGEDGLEIGKLYEYDIIILDLILPDLHGVDVMKRLRAAQIKTPILVLSGMDDTASKVESLCSGADDFLTKPYSKDELLARINAIIRRSNGYSDSIIKVGKLEINLLTRIASVNGQILHLTGKEYSILELLAIRKGAALTKESFLNHLYGGMDEPEIKIVDVFICKLRRKLHALTQQEGYIETIWGRGYMLRNPDEQSQYVARSFAPETDTHVVLNNQFQEQNHFHKRRRENNKGTKVSQRKLQNL